MSDTQISHHAQIHQVHNRQTLLNAISNAESGDTIEVTQEGAKG